MLRRYHGISIAKSMLVLTLSSKMWICYSCVNGGLAGKGTRAGETAAHGPRYLVSQKTHV